ncbi:MAG TPA: hypothetical protein VD907_00800 [Verrucomicrobiae bacterium]|nr:hypothetical protein [Verrucomicrobiae bacterium]
MKDNTQPKTSEKFLLKPMKNESKEEFKSRLKLLMKPKVERS